MRHSLPRLDLMIAYSCNIACLGCISISDRKREGVAKLSDIAAWIDKWHTVINPKTITLFGGEPCIHPKLIEICGLIRKYWNKSVIRLITNGYLLDNFNPEAWYNFEPFEIQVSIHRKDHEERINESIKKILIVKKGWKTSNHGDEFNQHKQLQWKLNEFTLYKSIFKDFIVPYKTTKEKLQAWHSDPKEAHKICGAPATPILYKGKLYKCPPVANVIDISGENWFNYNGYDVTDNIAEFIANINKPESVCGQCPDLSQAVIINHFNKDNVIVKSKSIN